MNGFGDPGENLLMEKTFRKIFTENVKKTLLIKKIVRFLGFRKTYYVIRYPY